MADRALALQALLLGAIVLRFVEEIKSVRTSRRLSTGVAAKSLVLRGGKLTEVGCPQRMLGHT